ncbi:MAG: 8-amino-7-oxononanoate synthase [Gammaproteobacteria bacterium]|nr:8-amino-7-oxononanoate synthase [Gammaproteobacteria bacterium]
MANFSQKNLKYKNLGYYRTRLVANSAQDVLFKLNKKKYISFASNDYLGLANNKKIKKAFIKGIDKYGIGSGASPLISGYTSAHQYLENELAEYLGFESALICNSGYLANIGLINAIAERNIVMLQDKENHNSIIQGSRLSSTKLVRYKHLSEIDLNNQLKKNEFYKEKIVFTESVFSMSGDISNIKNIHKISKKYGSLLFVDDAHGFCVMDKIRKKNTLPNVCSFQDINPKKIDAYIGTFGKAVGTFGAFIAGSKDLIQLLIQNSKPYIYSTSLPASIAEATRASLKLILKNHDYFDRLYENISLFRKYALDSGLKINYSITPIQTITIGNPIKVMKVHKLLLKKGLFVQAIRYPTVPKNCDKIRITITSNHKKQHIRKLINCLIEESKL